MKNGEKNETTVARLFDLPLTIALNVCHAARVEAKTATEGKF